ncbi:MAG: hypothetical protein R3Y64_09950 [Peptostreptococcaceae bacterium]
MLFLEQMDFDTLHVISKAIDIGVDKTILLRSDLDDDILLNANYMLGLKSSIDVRHYKANDIWFMSKINEMYGADYLDLIINKLEDNYIKTCLCLKLILENESLFIRKKEILKAYQVNFNENLIDRIEVQNLITETVIEYLNIKEEYSNPDLSVSQDLLMAFFVAKSLGVNIDYFLEKALEDKSNHSFSLTPQFVKSSYQESDIIRYLIEACNGIDATELVKKDISPMEINMFLIRAKALELNNIYDMGFYNRFIDMIKKIDVVSSMSFGVYLQLASDNVSFDKDLVCEEYKRAYLSKEVFDDDESQYNHIKNALLSVIDEEILEEYSFISNSFDFEQSTEPFGTYSALNYLVSLVNVTKNASDFKKILELDFTKIYITSMLIGKNISYDDIFSLGDYEDEGYDVYLNSKRRGIEVDLSEYKSFKSYFSEYIKDKLIN